MTSSTNVLSEIADPCPELIALVATLTVLLASLENRTRRRSKAAQATYDRTLIAVAAAIATNALSEVPPFDGHPISMDEHSYTGGPFSYAALIAILSGLDELKFVLKRRGFYDETNLAASFCTSFRHTWEFRDLVIEHGLKAEHTVSPPTDPIHLNDPDGEHLVPARIAATAPVLERYNHFITQFEITLPASAWIKLQGRTQKTGRNPRGRYSWGFSSKKIYLRRVFTRNYTRGGRLYGAWWINAPGEVRLQMRINGEKAVELDYVSIHPTMIAAKARLNHDFKPYDVGGFPNRKAAKKMFNRILNADGNVQFDGRKDKKVYGSSDAFYVCRDNMLSELSVISDKLQCDYGAKLQKSDSDLALRVIERCMDEGIPVCPVHDSFIVPRSRAEEVERIMKEEFSNMFNWSIEVSRK